MRRIDLCKTAADARRTGAADGALQCFGQRIVAAGIEDKNAQVLGLLQIGDDVVDARHQPQVRLVGQLGIHRHQVIDAAELHGVAAVIKKSNVGFACGAGKSDRGLVHARAIEVEGDHGLESMRLSAAATSSASCFGLVQPFGVVVAAVSDDEGNPLFGLAEGSRVHAGQ